MTSDDNLIIILFMGFVHYHSKAFSQDLVIVHLNEYKI